MPAPSILTPPPVALAVAPNGARRTQADHPALPIGPVALARTAADCAEAGAAMIHLHVRDHAGRHLLDATAYREAIAAIRAELGDRIVTQITSESLGLYSPAEQMAVVRDSRAEAVSLALREIAPGTEDEPALAAFLGDLLAMGTLPQIIVYDPSELIRLRGLLDRGALPFDDVPVLLALGRYSSGQTAAPADLLAFLNGALAGFAHWSCCAFGPNEARVVTTAALLGGHIRVGFENNLHLPDGATAPTNAALVAATAAGVRALGLPAADADGLRDAFRRTLGAT